jgi:hypothetical protein
MIFAYKCLENASQVFTLSAYPVNYALCNFKLGFCSFILYVESNLNYALDIAKTHLNNSIEVYNKKTYPKEYHQCQLLLGRVYYETGFQKDYKNNFINAIKAFEICLEYYTFDENPDIHFEILKGLRLSYKHLSYLESPIENLNKALFYTIQGKDLAKTVNQDKVYTYWLICLANCYELLSNHKDSELNKKNAKKYIKEAENVLDTKIEFIDSDDNLNDIKWFGEF